MSFIGMKNHLKADYRQFITKRNGILVHNFWCDNKNSISVNKSFEIWIPFIWEWHFKHLFVKKKTEMLKEVGMIHSFNRRERMISTPNIVTINWELN